MNSADSGWEQHKNACMLCFVCSFDMCKFASCLLLVGIQ